MDGLDQRLYPWIAAIPFLPAIWQLTEMTGVSYRNRSDEICAEWRLVPKVKSSCICCFAAPQGDLETTVARLRVRRIQVAARCGKVRAAPHFYNTEQEIDRVLEALS